MKNSSRIHGIYFLFCLLFVSSCGRRIEGKGPVRTQDRKVESFNNLAINLPALVHIQDSGAYSCVVKAEENLLDAIVTRMDGKTLVITAKGELVPNEEIEIFITTNRISKIELNGSGEIRSTGTLKTENADLELNGSGRLDLDLVAVEITAGVSGSGNLHLGGSCNDLSLEINGSGKTDASGLNALSVKVKVLGSGEAFVNASERLKAKVTGSGVVRYKGNAAVDKDISGSGDVTMESASGS